jgi:SAM-dependent methyltransferase
MSDQDSAATQTTWTNEAAEKWLSRVDGIERSGAPIRELLMERAHLQPGERVLDVGCGSGPSTAAAATAVHPGGMVTGIDIAAPMISAARQRLGNREIEWIVGDAETYPLPEGHYDAIISQMGLMFFTNNARPSQTWLGLVEQEVGWLALSGPRGTRSAHSDSCSIASGRLWIGCILRIRSRHFILGHSP